MLDAGDQISKIIDVNVTKLQHWYKLIEIETITFSHRRDDCGRKGRYERYNCTQSNVLLYLKTLTDRQVISNSIKIYVWTSVLNDFNECTEKFQRILIWCIMLFQSFSHRKIYFFFQKAQRSNIGFIELWSNSNLH